MKLVAILFLVTVIASQAQANFILRVIQNLLNQKDGELSLIQRALTAGARTRCRWTEKMSQQEEDEMRANHFENLSKKQQCFIKCVTDTFRFAEIATDLLPENENALASTFSKILDPLVKEDDAAVISAECNKLTGEDDCATSAAVFSCYAKHNATSLI